MKPSDELAKRFDEHDRSFEQTKVGVYAALTILITMAIYTMAQTVFQMVIKTGTHRFRPQMLLKAGIQKSREVKHGRRHSGWGVPKRWHHIIEC